MLDKCKISHRKACNNNYQSQCRQCYFHCFLYFLVSWQKHFSHHGGWINSTNTPAIATVNQQELKTMLYPRLIQHNTWPLPHNWCCAMFSSRLFNQHFWKLVFCWFNRCLIYRSYCLSCDELADKHYCCQWLQYIQTSTSVAVRFCMWAWPHPSRAGDMQQHEEQRQRGCTLTGWWLSH